MNQSAIVRRAWELVRRYRVLWLFGVLVALTSGTGSNVSNYSWNARDFERAPWKDIPWLQAPNLPFNWGSGFAWPAFPANGAGIVALCCCLILIFVVAFIVLNAVSRAALIRSAAQIEETGTAPTWRQGFRLGWTNRTFRMWLLELLTGIITGLAALLLIAFAASPLLLLLTRTDAGRVIGIVGAVLLGLLVLLVLFVVGIVLSVLQEFWAREILLSNRSIGDAFAAGWAQARSHAGNLALLWLLMLAIGIGFAIVMIPVALLVLAIAGGLGAGLGYVLNQLTDSIGLAIGIGLPLFLLVLAIPLSLIGGLYAAFKSNVWTLAFREVVNPPVMVATPEVG